MKFQGSLTEALQDVFGSETVIMNRKRVSGGDINQAYLLELSNRTLVFMKSNRIENLGFFQAEVECLLAMKETGAVQVPEVLALGTQEGTAFLLLSCIEEGRKTRESSVKLGRSLANMHMADSSKFMEHGRYGFLHDNYIGASVQVNDPKDSWVEFFADCRLLPQFRKAASWFEREDRTRFDALISKLDRYLPEPEHPSLLHGDLWGGNYMIDKHGDPWLIDPAAYVGHREADLAMTELFGGFDRDFYDAYNETAGIEPEYQNRRDLYNLYHLLNHLNLFGGSYLQAVLSIIRKNS